MRVGVIGCGSIGARHARNAIALGHFVELVEQNTERGHALFDELSGIPFAGSATQGIGPDVLKCDAVLICTPAKTHAEIGRELRDSGYAGPLFVEKPLALSSEDCEVFRTWPHPTTMVGYMLRFHPVAQAMKQLVPEPDFGEFELTCDPTRWPGANYGPVALEASHELDLAFWLGMPKDAKPCKWMCDEVTTAVSAGRRDEWSFQVHDQSEYSKYFEYWRVWRVGKYARQQPQPGKKRHVETEMKRTFRSPAELGTEMYRAELAHFLDCVQQNKPTITPFADGIRVVEVIEAAMKMAQERACSQ